MKYFSLTLFVMLTFYACDIGKPLSRLYTFEDKTVFDLIEKLNKTPADEQSALLLPQAYKAAADKRKENNQASLGSGHLGDRYMDINKELQVMQQMYTAIKSSPAASKVVPNPWDPTQALQRTRQKAAQEYYAQGLEYLNYNNRPYALKAYDYLKKANAAVPGYEDVRNLMNEAIEKGTLKVVVSPVNYHRLTWSAWGFQEDFLQQKMVRDLNAGTFSDTRFYTDRDASLKRINADRHVDMNFIDLYVDGISSDRYIIQRSAQIQVGSTKSIPAQPVYQTVKATIQVTRSFMQSYATLECRIYDYASGRDILFDRFPNRDSWEQKTATYRGDIRALTQEDLAMIRNTNNSPPPSRNQIASRMISNCYGLLLSRIKSGVNFN